ncbi:MAG: hypothetical protein QMD05_10335, partial [Candidatus Brocadiaceae bacterium]|nr:hypothetical protein [Candidatus Brocadiaceae bacterium]
MDIRRRFLSFRHNTGFFRDFGLTKNRFYKVFSIFPAVILFCFGLSTAPCEGKEKGINIDMDAGYELYDQVLQKYVKDGKVDYLTLRGSPEELGEYLSWL